MIGRSDELRQLEQWVKDGARIVTITGPPGIGKTTLARVVAGADSRRAVVALSDCQDAAAAVEQLSNELLGEGAGCTTPTELGGRLGHAGFDLVVLDNLEQLLPAAAGALRELVDAASEVTFVATSRRRIGWVDEHLLELGPLSMEAVDGGPSEAAQLFATCANRVVRGVCAPEDDTPGMAAVLERTAGVPLALELAAARLRLLDIDELGLRLGESLELLSTAGTGIRGLHASLETSWALLSDVERDASSRLAVLPGTLPFGLAEAVVGGPEAFDTIQRLRDDSLLTHEDGGIAMLPYIREFARARLKGHEVVDEVGSALAEFGRQTRERFESQGHVRDLLMLGQLQPASVEVLASTSDRELRCQLSMVLAVHLRRRGTPATRAWFLQLARSLDDPDPARAARRAADIAAIMARGGDAKAGLELLDALGEVSDAGARAAVSSAAADLAQRTRDFERADRELDVSIAIFEERGEQLNVARDQIERGSVAYWRGDQDGARLAWEGALRLSQAVGSDYVAAVASSNLCFICALGGDAHQSVVHGERALEVFRAARDRRAEATTLNFLGMSRLNLGELDQAEALFEQVSKVHRLIGEALQEAFAIANLAHVATLRGDAVGARQHLTESERLGRALETPLLALHNAESHADLALRTGDIGAALSKFSAALDHEAIETIPQYRLHYHARRGALRARSGDHEGAAADFERVAELRPACAMPDYVAASYVYESLFSEDVAAQVAATLRPQASAARRTIENSVVVRQAVDEVREHWSAEKALDLLARAHDPEAEALVYRAGSSRYRLPGGDWLDLAKRSTLAPLLQSLIDASREGRCMTLDELFEAVWPGEVAEAESAANRVYNAIALLRKSGLEGVLVKDADGYRVAPDVAITPI